MESILNFHHFFNSKDINLAREKLNKFLDILIFLNEVLAEEKFKAEEHDIYSEQLLIKFYLHGLTILKISDAYPIQSKYYREKIKNANTSIKTIDISSLMTVSRAQLETLLMYQHLYINSNDKDEQMLRFKSYILAPLIYRSEAFHSHSEYIKERKNNDANSINNLREEIKKLKSFERLSTKQQKALLEKGSGKLFKHWDTIFKESGFSENGVFSKLYYLLSSYSHSEGLVVLQLKEAQYFNSKHNNESLFQHLFFSLIMTAIMIKNISNKFDLVRSRFDKIEDKDKAEIEIFSKLPV